MESLRPFVEQMPDFFRPWGEEILLRFFDFEGRTDRRTFWQVVLVNFIIAAVLSALVAVPIIGGIVAIVDGLYGVAMIIPGIAMQVRRLRDTGRDWPYILMGLIPCVGWIILIIFYVQDSQ